MVQSELRDRLGPAERRERVWSRVSRLALEIDPSLPLCEEELLPKIAALAIPELADWSAVDLTGERETSLVSLAHRDPKGAALAVRLEQFRPWQGGAVWEQLMAGRSVLLPEVSDEFLQLNVSSTEHLATVRELGLRSSMAVPIRLRDATLAVLTFAITSPERRLYGAEDLALAEDLASRAAFIIDRARINAELNASNARLRLTLEMAGACIFEQDRELRYRWILNPPFPGEFTGEPMTALFPPGVAEDLSVSRQRVLTKGESIHEERRVPWHDGREHTVKYALEPVRDAHGTITGVLGALTDITAEKRVQEEISEEMRFRERLMGILGHDLRNPLSAVLTSTALIRKMGTAPPLSKYVERIERSARRMSEMIDTLLDFTHVRSHGSLPISRRTTDLGEVARTIVDEISVTKPERVLALDVKGDARGHWDPARLGQLLSNLVSNALTHGDPGEPVRVAIDAGGQDVVLRVHNRGAVIPEENVECLFQPYRRDSPAGGLGLGLFIVRQIVVAHRGKIRVRSTATDGTTFEVELPRQASE